MNDRTENNSRLDAVMKISQAPTIGPRILSPERAPNRSARGRTPTKLRLPTGEPDLAAIEAVISDWLVPLLVKEFMAEYNAKPATEAVQSQQTSVPRKGRKARNAER